MSGDRSDQREHSATGRPSRRSVVASAGGVALGSIGVFGGASTASAAESTAARRETTLAAGTRYETDVFVNESGQSGPTAAVIGGVHGNEPSGAEVARRVRDWSLDRGTLVVIPEANVPALESGTRESSDGDLNRQFPTGSRPEWPIAEDVWDAITRHDADVVIDLHSARGIYRGDHGPGGSVGQAIFPSAAGDSRSIADRVTTAMNEHHVDGSYHSDYDFEVGNSLGGSRPLLVHKAAGDLERPGYLTEVTRYETDSETRVDWTAAMAARLLEHHGIGTEYANQL